MGRVLYAQLKELLQHDERKKGTVALNPGCHLNCATCYGYSSLNTSVLLQHHTELVVAAQNK